MQALLIRQLTILQNYNSRYFSWKKKMMKQKTNMHLWERASVLLLRSPGGVHVPIYVCTYVCMGGTVCVGRVLGVDGNPLIQ